jgi:hypothetical protein
MRVTSSRSARILACGTFILLLIDGAAVARSSPGPEPSQAGQSSRAVLSASRAGHSSRGGQSSRAGQPPPAPQPQPLLVPIPASLAPDGAVGRLTAAQALQAAQTCAEHAATAGWADNGSYGGNLETATAVCVAESGGNPRIYYCDSHGNKGVYPPVYCPGGLYDRGLWQLNSKYHPDVSDTCAFRAQCNADAAYEISTRGASFAPWAVYGSASYARYLAAAEAAVSGLSAGSIPSALFGICLARGQNTAGSPVVIRRCGRRHWTEQWTVNPHTIHQGSLCLAAGAVGQPAVIVDTCAVSDSQVWTTFRGDQLRNLQNGDCLADPGASRHPGTPVDLAPCTGTRQQTWWLP